MLRRLLSIAGMILVPLAVLSCYRPASDELFVRHAGRDEAGRYLFTLAMDGEGEFYDIDIYLVTEYAWRESMPGGRKALLEMTSPEGTRYEGRLDLDRPSAIQKSVFTTTYMYGYGRNLLPVSAGDWTLAVTLPAEIDKRRHLDGVGIRLKRNGTR